MGSVPTRPALLLYRCLRPFSTTAQQQSASINSHGCPRTRLPGVGEGEAAHNSVQPAGLLMQLRYAIWSFSADVQAVSSAVPPQPPVYAVPMAPTLIRKPHSPALLNTLLRHRNAHRPGSKKHVAFNSRRQGPIAALTILPTYSSSAPTPWGCCL